MQYEVRINRSRTPNPDFIHGIKLLDGEGNVAASAFAWTSFPSDTMGPQGRSALVDFKAKTPQQARIIHETLAKVLTELGLPDDHPIVCSLKRTIFKRANGQFTGFQQKETGDKFTTLGATLADYYDHYIPDTQPIEPEIKPGPKTVVPKIKLTKPAALNREIEEATEKPDINRVSDDVLMRSHEITLTTRFIKTLMTVATKQTAPNVVLAHVLATLPAKLISHTSLIANANQTVDESEFEGMAVELNKLPPATARQIVEHVVKTTREITNALELLRSHKVQFKHDKKPYDANSTIPSHLNDEAIKLNHALVMGYTLSKHAQLV